MDKIEIRNRYMNYQDKLLFDNQSLQTVIRKIGAIDTFKGKWSSIENKNDRYLRELRKIATVESIGSSTRIEGAILTDKEVANLIGNIKITEFKSRDEEEVFGYYEALDIILDNASEIEFSESYIKQLHSLLLKYSGKDQRHKGEYKNLSNKVVANYPDGSQRVIFNTTPPHITRKEMQELLEWVSPQLKNNDFHPLLIIGLFVYEFLSIHPFQDGNGRLSRLLTTLLLLKTGYEFAQYVSFEHIIEQRKTDYYKALIQGQQQRGTEKEIIGDWMLFFLSSLEMLIERLEAKYASYKETGGYLNDRQKEILKYIENSQPVKLGDMSKAFVGISVNTLKKDLQYMVNENVISKMGVKKGTLYIVHKKQ